MCWHLFLDATEHIVQSVSNGTSPFLATPHTKWPKQVPSHLVTQHFKLDAHRIYEIAFLHEGVCLMYLGGRHLLMEPGDLCLIPPNVPHYEAPVKADTRYLLCWIRMMIPHASLFFSEYKPDAQYYELSACCHVFPCSNSISVFEQVLEEERKNEKFKEAIIRGLLLNWLGVIARQVDQMAKTGGMLFNPKLSKVINTIDQYIQERLHDPELRVSDMAQQLWLSPNYFTKHFYRLTGKTPHQYLLEKRLNTARRLLVETDETIGAIAAAVGFRAPHHFSRIFRRYYGVSPTTFRASYQAAKL
ncbi:MAG TPA: AraC family transcriptional regulator [Firmicutes bacterium]|nr:AraC family transcriptional regulator [Bacillota bacterium]